MARFPFWKGMVDALIVCGLRFKPPTYYDFRGPLLQEFVNDIQLLVDNQHNIWNKRGCTVISDGLTAWSNFLVASKKKGVVFLKSVDASTQIKSLKMLANLLEEIVLELGVENVVQVIMDDATTYVVVGRILEAKFPTLLWTPWPAHCFELLLEDIGKLQWVIEDVQKYKCIIKFIYKHTWVLQFMRKYMNGRKIACLGVPRFAINFITLQSLFDTKGGFEEDVCGQWLGTKSCCQILNL